MTYPNEEEAQRLAAISTAALMNTRETFAQHRIGRDSPYWTQAYEDVCTAVTREMQERERADRAERRIEAFMAQQPIYNAALACAGAIATALKKQGQRLCDCGSAPQGMCCCGCRSQGNSG